MSKPRRNYRATYRKVQIPEARDAKTGRVLVKSGQMTIGEVTLRIVGDDPLRCNNPRAVMRRIQATRQKLSAAAKKGWETRRRHAQA